MFRPVMEPLALILISFFGGLLGYVMRTIDAKEQVRMGIAFLEGLSSAFFGMLMYAIYKELNISLWLAFTFAGLFAWAGSRATVRALKAVVQHKLGINLNSGGLDENNTK